MGPDDHDLTRLAQTGRFELLRGRRARSDAKVLVKRPVQARAASAEITALQRECALAASLRSAATLLPRLVEVPGSLHLVMEDPGGELLAARLAAGRPDISEVLAIGEQVADALAELHRRGLLHNGVRPEAILCDADARRAWLVDFADAAATAVLPGAPSAARLVYLAPEQTGRIDRTPDARSDLYALGIVLYEALTGAPPFRSDDALAQIHWHIAGILRAPAQLDPAIPTLLSDVVMKLLAKAPDERYQSAEGLAQDLAQCARDWNARGRITPFPLGRRDIGERLVISPRLVGREREVHVLLEAFEAACAGRGGGSLLLVEGYAGIGKTALIQQLYRPIVRQKGYFLSGKFDQVVRGVPFGALIQAFRGLVRQLLTESEAQLARWRATLADALGGNGGVLAEVIPEIEFIVGPQPEPAVLGSVEAQNRFQRVLQQFVAAIAQPEHPLVLFLDDLQWADAATLGLLEPLLAGGEIRCLMLMGAYRDNELDASPRLARTLSALGSAGVSLQRVILGPLRHADLTTLVADSLHCNAAQAAPLAELVHAKTGGNPFFVIQCLKSLEREGHLRFDADEARWVYRIEQIANSPLADNVVDLMTRSIQRLPPRSQYALTLAACIGNRFDASTLAIVSEQSSGATAEDLDQALAEGLIVEATGEPGSFTFLHDRVQQAAYALIPAERRQMVHLTVGRLLRARANANQLEAGAFDIVQHLNLGRSLIRERGERHEVAALNLAAGRRAKSSTAHDTALELFQAGIELLDESAWAHADGLAFALHLEAAESRYLCGQFDAAQRDMAMLIERAPTAIDRAQVVRLRSVAYENMARYADALESSREGLALFDVAFPRDEAGKLAALEQEIGRIETLRAGRAIAALVELPTMHDANVRMVMSMLTDSWSAAYIIGDPTLARLISATMVRLSLQHGNVEESAYGYVTHAITVGPVRGEYRAADEFGRLALAVNDRFDDRRRRAKIYQQFHAHVNLWCQPLRTCMAYAREACRSGLDSGDFLYAAYGAATEAWSAIVATQDLAQFVREHAPSIALVERLKATGFADSTRVIVNWARALQGRTQAPLSLSDASFDEDAYVRQYRDNPFFATIHAVARLQIGVLLGTPAQALAAARHAAGLVHNVPGTVWPVIHEFWHGLALAGSLDGMAPAERAEAAADLHRAVAAFDVRATYCAENYQCPAWLLAAESARTEGRERDAIELCERAIEFTADKPLIAYQALAHELCARAHGQRGHVRLDALHRAQARAAYAQWGALAKVQRLDAEASEVVSPAGRRRGDALPRPDAPPFVPAQSVASDTADTLDLLSVLKASQAIAAEVEFDALQARLLRIAIENAGAERGALVLEDAQGPRVHASADAGAEAGGQVAPHGEPLDPSAQVPIGLVNYVRRTGESVVLAQAADDEQHGSDPYMLRCRPRSVLCVPMRRAGRASGVLYLENRSVGGVFTAQRLRTTAMLATQAAISLENARLVAGLKQEIAERQQAQAEVERLKDDLEAENSYLRRDLVANVSHDLRTPLVAMRGYLELLATRGDGLTGEQRQQYLGIAVRQSEHLATLIDELFELAKLDFKGMTLNREPFAFGELAVDVLQKFQLAADERRVELRIDAAAHLPFVEADLSLMERVLENLIGNALQHTPAGGRVTVGVYSEGDALQVQVADTGRGIPVAELPFIFDRFYRGTDSRKRSAGGAGLGLAISKRIVELHQGEIGVESDGVSGSRFRFRLPIRSAP